nr:unnamed protein product [Callosobruchus analis]
MSTVSVFSCLRRCLDGIKYQSNITSGPRENLIHLDTAFMGYEVVIVKAGLRTCGAGAALGNAPLVQSKSYFEVKVQQGGSWSVGLATRQTDLSLTQGGMDEYSWAICDDHTIRHNKEDLYKVKVAKDDSDTEGIQKLQESDIIGVAYDHIQLKFFVNGKEVDYAVTSVKGTVYPALYVNDGAILDIVLDNFNFSPPPGFEKIMLEQSLL